jgi:pyruvate dehydrogenase (quinone)
VHNPDFAALAELCGAKGWRVTHVDELDEALTAAIAHDGPALVDVVTDVALI